MSEERHYASVEISDEILDWLQTVAPGTLVTRLVGGIVSSELLATAVDDDFIYCATLKFSKKTSAEINEELGWDENNTGALLVPPKPR